MGTWSSSLYGNDTTCDVRDAYMSFLKEQFSNDDAYEKTLEQFRETIDGDEEPLFWFALAETQWKVGRLTPEVKKNALDWIERKGGLERWLEYGGNDRGWLKTLEKLQRKLESTMPQEKKIRKPEEINMNPWELNDVYAYQFNKKIAEENGVLGKYMLIQKIGEEEDRWIRGDKDKPVMRVQIFDKIFDEMPTLGDMKKLRILPLDMPKRYNISKDVIADGVTIKKEPIQMSVLMLIYKKFEYPKKHLTFLGNAQGLPNANINNLALSWLGIDRWLYDSYMDWQGVDYDTVGYGEYDYLGNL